MKPEQLQHYNGAAIEMSVDGAEAIGILFLAEPKEAYVVSVCYTKRRSKCPQVQHVLSSEEINSITPKSRNKLNSNIDVASKDSPAAACARPLDEAGDSSDDLIARVQKTHKKARSLKNEFEQLKAEGAAIVGKLKNVQSKLGGQKGKSTSSSYSTKNSAPRD